MGGRWEVTVFVIISHYQKLSHRDDWLQDRWRWATREGNQGVMCQSGSGMAVYLEVQTGRVLSPLFSNGVCNLLAKSPAMVSTLQKAVASAPLVASPATATYVATHTGLGET